MLLGFIRAKRAWFISRSVSGVHWQQTMDGVAVRQQAVEVLRAADLGEALRQGCGRDRVPARADDVHADSRAQPPHFQPDAAGAR